jgi:hypothetical protein
MSALFASHQARDAGQSAQAREAEQGGVLEHGSQRRDRAEQIEPALAFDEVVRLRIRSPQTDREVDQKDDTDQVVVELEQTESGVAERQHHHDHHDQRHDRENEDEQLVGVALWRPGYWLLVHGGRDGTAWRRPA